ncbi:MAG: STAS domain-containing protein [Bacteroidales bacterium]|nr:STAS domain-containing protein [Bacteroidales bacterium]
MTINFSLEDGYTLINLGGRLDTSNYEEASQQIDNQIDMGQRKLIINLEQLEYISSSGLRVLMSALKKVKALGGNLILCNVPEKIMEVFEISGFNTLFVITKDLENAKQKITA